MGSPEGMTRCRFGFTGDGETGSPRRRFRARDTADVGCGGRETCDEDATGWMRGNGSGDGSFDLGSLRGVENRFGIGRVCWTCKTPLPLFLTGEKGLVDATGGPVLTAWDLEINCFDCCLGGVNGCVLALYSFLYSLYFSAVERASQWRCGNQLSSKHRTNIWPVLDVLDSRISSIISLEVPFPSFDFCAEGDDVHGRRGRQRSESDAEMNGDVVELKEKANASRRPAGSLFSFLPISPSSPSRR